MINTKKQLNTLHFLFIIISLCLAQFNNNAYTCSNTLQCMPPLQHQTCSFCINQITSIEFEFYNKQSELIQLLNSKNKLIQKEYMAETENTTYFWTETKPFFTLTPHTFGEALQLMAHGTPFIHQKHLWVLSGSVRHRINISDQTELTAVSFLERVVVTPRGAFSVPQTRPLTEAPLRFSDSSLSTANEYYYDRYICSGYIPSPTEITHAPLCENFIQFEFILYPKKNHHKKTVHSTRKLFHPSCFSLNLSACRAHFSECAAAVCVLNMPFEYAANALINRKLRKKPKNNTVIPENHSSSSEVSSSEFGQKKSPTAPREKHFVNLFKTPEIAEYDSEAATRNRHRDEIKNAVTYLKYLSRKIHTESELDEDYKNSIAVYTDIQQPIYASADEFMADILDIQNRKLPYIDFEGHAWLFAMPNNQKLEKSPGLFHYSELIHNKRQPVLASNLPAAKFINNHLNVNCLTIMDSYFVTRHVVDERDPAINDAPFSPSTSTQTETLCICLYLVQPRAIALASREQHSRDSRDIRSLQIHTSAQIDSVLSAIRG